MTGTTAKNAQSAAIGDDLTPEEALDQLRDNLQDKDNGYEHRVMFHAVSGIHEMVEEIKWRQNATMAMHGIGYIGIVISILAL